jgi:hypothetical protein
MTVKKIVSGGQTGVDRAALDVALALGLRCGGWCPKGRRAEDGRIPERYPLRETPTAAYPQRTEWNIRDSDGTLVLTVGSRDRGTALTLALAARLGRPCLELDLRTQPQAARVREWAHRRRIETLNVAGPRESRAPGIAAQARTLLRAALE